MQKNVFERARAHPVPSLKKLGLLRVTTMLCNNQQLLQLIDKVHMNARLSNYYVKVSEADWSNVQIMANRWFGQLMVGVKLEEDIREMLWTMSYRIYEWKEMYANTLSNRCLTPFYWTDQGRIDSIKTIRYMVRYTRLPLRERFTLACSMCLNEEIREMWSKMSDADKQFCYETNGHDFHPLVIFWAHCMGGPYGKIDSCKESAIICAMLHCLVEAVKYLFSYLTKHEKESMALKGISFLVFTFKRCRVLTEQEIEIFYLLFFEMSEENQEMFFSSRSLMCLYILLHSPENELFLHLLSERIRLLSGQSVEELLRTILHNYHLGITDYNYGVLFIDVWRMLPSRKRHFLQKSLLGLGLLIALINDHFPCLLEEKALQKIPKLVASAPKCSKPATRFGFHRGRWNFLHTLIREEVVKVASIKKNMRKFSYFIYAITKRRDVDKRISNRILRFVTNARNKIPVS